MAIYTVSLNFLENLQPNEVSYLGCILFCFTNNQHPSKLAVDRDKTILSMYRNTGKFAHIIKTWLDMLSYIPSAIEQLNVDIKDIDDTEEMCLALCSTTNGTKNLIVHSMASLSSYVDDDGCVTYNGHKIHILDKDEAMLELNKNSIVNISNSQIAGRDICKSMNTSAYEE